MAKPSVRRSSIHSMPTPVAGHPMSHDLAAEALMALTEQTFANMKHATPVLEELLRAAMKYQAVLVQCNLLAGEFVECLGKVAVEAQRTRGGTYELGQHFQRAVGHHRTVVQNRQAQSMKMEAEFIQPLSRRLKLDTRTLPKMEDEVKSSHKKYRRFRSEAKNSRGDDEKSKSFELYSQRCLRAALIEERRRYCFLVQDYCNVFGYDFQSAENRELIKTMLASTENPDELPLASEFIISQNSTEEPPPTLPPKPVPLASPSALNAHSSVNAKARQSSARIPTSAPPPVPQSPVLVLQPVVQPPPQSPAPPPAPPVLLQPTPITREVEQIQRRRAHSPSAIFAPGCPPGGIRVDREMRASEGQLNPRRATADDFSPGAHARASRVTFD
eukprot:m.224932 g.224932  ORF g.224932 m.224932 type:complete len:387 (+) comp11174_c0_seq1:24-1184(+)